MLFRSGLLQAGAVLVINTADTPGARERTAFGDPLDTLWRRCIFDLCGVRVFHRRVFSVVVMSTLQQRRLWLREAMLLASKLFPKTAQPQAGR